MKSHRDNVKDAILKELKIEQAGPRMATWSDTELNELKWSITDAVFDALDITQQEQSMLGGSFILRAGREPS
jgi:hypothetical protein